MKLKTIAAATAGVLVWGAVFVFGWAANAEITRLRAEVRRLELRNETCRAVIERGGGDAAAAFLWRHLERDD